MNKDDMLLFGDIVNNHHDEVMKKSMGMSLVQEEVKYNETKKVPLKKLRRALIIALMILALSLGTIKFVHAMNTSEVNEIIGYYQSMMDSTNVAGENDHSIENFVKYNYAKGNDPVVSYDAWNNENFVNYILEASRADNPVTEVRCALIAAYKVINEPYREDQFDILFKRIRNNEEFIKNTGFDGSKDNIWQMLGYKDMKDFQENARKDTKDIYLTEKDGKYGKGM